MMESDSGTVRSVNWKELCPWLNILQVFRLSVAFPALLCGAVGIVLTATGWWFLATVFGTDANATAWLTPYGQCPWTAVTAMVPDRPELPGMLPVAKQPAKPTTPAPKAVGKKQGPAIADMLPNPAERREARKQLEARGLAPDPNFKLAEEGGKLAPFHVGDPVFSSWVFLNTPLTQGLAHAGLTLRALVCLVLCGMWGAGIWAFFGAAITRIAAVQLASGEHVGLGAALRHASAKWISYVAAPLGPVLAAAACAVCIFIVGIFARGDFPLFFVGILWPLVILAGAVMTILLLGALFGWPLMWATISTEGTDSFDAWSRAYTYTFQRPLRYLFYAVVAAIIGALAWLLVKNVAAGIIWLGYWSASLACGADRIEAIMQGSGIKGLFGGGGVWLIHLWTGCVKVLAVGFLFSYFWSSASCIYLLLRRDVDATEMDEVFLDADASENALPLPPIGSDDLGAPVVDEPNADAQQEPAGDDNQPPKTDEQGPAE